MINIYPPLEGSESDQLTVTQYENAVLSDLVTAVASYLGGSSKRAKSVQFMTGGIAAIVYSCVIVEIG